ncbi:MAG: XrtA system polysaccharide chain length determinant [Candidatus Rokuibacteriota bacterium]
MSDSVGSMLDDADQPLKGAGIDRLRAIWSRRKWLAILVFLIPLAGAVSLVMALPNVYRSTATVLIERQQLPEDLVRATVNSEVEVRLRTLSAEILRRSRLEQLIRRFGLYSDLGLSTEDAVNRMRRDISMQPTSTGPRGAGTTVSFALNYQGRDPENVALVTNALASFYIEENLKVRERLAIGTTEFLRLQVEEAKKRLDDQERRISELSREHRGELPPQMPGNLTRIESLAEQLRVNRADQLRAQQRRDALAAQVAQAEASSGFETDPMRLARLRHELAALRVKYTDRWPDIIRIKDEIATLERKLANPQPQAKAPEAPPLGLTPEILRLREALKSADTDIRLLKTDEERVRSALDLYQKRVDNAPKVEPEYQELTRGYETNKSLYRALLQRYETAQIGENMEQRQQGERFKILDPARPSGNPFAPNRARLLVVTVAMCVGLAGAALVLAEVLDTSFHSAADLGSGTAVPVLVRIPSIVTERDTRRRRWRFRFVAVGTLVALILVSGASYRFGHGNEQLVYMLSREGNG